MRYGDFDSESGYAQMNSLLDVNPDLTAAFVASDVVAFGAMAAVRERGLRIPQDISLVGFDNVPFSRYVDPGLTTIQLPVVELARRASEMVVGMIRGEPPAQPQVLLDANLTVRNSCCEARER